MIPEPDLVELAARFHRRGALEQAEALYRAALQRMPASAELWKRLGQVCQSLGRHDDAAGCYRRALEVCPGAVDARTALGLALFQQRCYDEADSCFREALQLRPDDPRLHDHLGRTLLRRGHPEEAEVCFRRALSLDPGGAASHAGLGNALAWQGKSAEAVDCYRAAVALEPDRAHAWFDLGGALAGLGEADEAAACFEHAAQLSPGDPHSPNELGVLRMRAGDLARAAACFERALELRPDFVNAYNNLGLVLMAQGRFGEARFSFEQALYLRPDLAEACNNLGLAFLNQDRAHDARACFERALSLKPDLADARNNLGLALTALGALDEAVACFEDAARLDPSHLGSHVNLGNAYKDQGQVAEAVAVYRAVLARWPDQAAVHSNLLLAMQYQAGLAPDAVHAEALRFAARHERSLRQTHAFPPAGNLAGRRLRIGYVSGDFREHPVAYFLEPLLAAHDRERCEIFAYSDVAQHDAATERLRGHVDQWRSLVGLSDAQATEMIRHDGIDVLIDLAGHTGGNRLLTFARRAAPIQASYLGFLGTTGLSTMDYYFSDALADPPGISDSLYVEELVRLPECAFCYGLGAAPDVGPGLRGAPKGRVTYGCLNSLTKVSDESIRLWSQVMAAVPGSRLVLRTGEGRRAEQRIVDALGSHGIMPDRLAFRGRAGSRFDYLKFYDEIDIALDPFPYNGVTTTCDALWMGVPVVTLAGTAGPARQGVRFLRSVGLAELVAQTPEEYVRIAAELAGDEERLAVLHSGLRDSMGASPLMDARRLARDIEAASRALCERRLSAPDVLSGSGRSE